MCPYRFLYLTAEVQSAFQLCDPHSRAVYDTGQHINSSLRLLELISQSSWDFTPNQIAFVIFIVSYCFCFSGLFMGLLSWKWVISLQKADSCEHHPPESGKERSLWESKQSLLVGLLWISLVSFCSDFGTHTIESLILFVLVPQRGKS